MKMPPKKAIVRLIDKDKKNNWIVEPVFKILSGKIKIFVRGDLNPEIRKNDTIAIQIVPYKPPLYEGIFIRKMTNQKSTVLGVYNQGIVYPIDKKIHQDFKLPSGKKSINNLELIKLNITSLFGKNPQISILERIKNLTNLPFWQTYLSKYMYHLKNDFPKEVEQEVKSLTVPNLSEHRIDLTHIPFVTIDGEDAKDFDDAVFAEPDTNPKNKEGWHIFVAIADVSYYVRSGSMVDKESFYRGNSTYFPDSVVPMLPEKLCNDLCSLRPNCNRASLVAEIFIDKDGRKLSHQFNRALIRSVARLTYTEVQNFMDKNLEISGLNTEITHLIGAYQSLKKHRSNRGVLELDVPEQQVKLDTKGDVLAITKRKQLPAHQLIEEFMILANVASAEILETFRSPVIYRVHAGPSKEKMETFNSFIAGLDKVKSLKETAKAKDFNELLKKIQDKEQLILMSQLALRTQSKAIYSPKNIGHYGLSLEKYAHFTSPIRRYADLIVHRCLVKALELGVGGLTGQEKKNLAEIATHISERERLSATAEQDTLDRYACCFFKNKIGKTFKAHISNVSSFGLNIILDDYSISGFIPKRLLEAGIYDFDENKQTLFSRNSKNDFTFGDKINVVLKECMPYSGNMIFALKK